MKPAFNIPPSAADNNSLSLLIESGSFGMSFFWFEPNPFAVKGIVAYNFPAELSGKDIKEIIVAQQAYTSGVSSVTLCYDYRDSVLIPAGFNDSGNNEGAVSLVYGQEPASYYNNDLVTSAGLYNHYRVPADIAAVLSGEFPSAAVFHSTSLQVEQSSQEKELLYCILFHNVLKVILFKEGKLQIAQQFDYLVPEDVAYHLINVCEQHAVKPSAVELRLSGMIDEQSRLYTELYKYFLHISFEQVANGVYKQEAIEDLPAHFFSHLTVLALCVS